MTEKLYDQDSYLRSFTARVLHCEEGKQGWVVTLDRTAFFPEGGGQKGDIGLLGGRRVLDTHEKGGVISHYTDGPIPVGELVTGELDWETRFRRMQNHSGEHILSGIVYRQYGYQNVGFHLGDGDVTVDFDGELSREQLQELELEANRAVWENVPVRAYYPSPTALKRLKYRSKLDLTENVRIVRIPGYDLCACCAPHVKCTGSIGSIKILDFMRHRGGVRLHMLCGRDALEDHDLRYRSTLEISGLLSAKQHETPAAVRRVSEELENTRQQLLAARRKLLEVKAAALRAVEGNLCLFEAEMDGQSLRELVNAAMEKAGGVCAAFTGRDGDYKYVIGSRSIDLRRAAKTVNAAIGGRGGGQPEMIQGSAAGTRAEIEAFFAAWKGEN